jgi:hypothetical protein
MDPRANPYAPGAGTQPQELSGRDELIKKALIATDRLRAGLPSRSLILVGLRGVGKTVLLNKIANECEALGMVTLNVEMPEQRSLPSVLIPPMRAALLTLDRMAQAGNLAKKAMQTLGSFVGAMKLKFEDIEFSLDVGKQAGVADTGDLEHDLLALFLEVGKAAQEKKTALVLCIDEMQYIPEDQFAALITVLHKCAQQRLPVGLIGAGLPMVVGRAGRAKSYAERLFEYPELGPLNKADAAAALERPAQALGVHYAPAALQEIFAKTQGYPYFLQEWGKHSWDCATRSPITLDDARAATSQALIELDASFFRTRLERCTPSEKKYLRAMAELGPGPHRSGDIAAQLNKEVQKVAPVRASLMKKGMIYSLAHGDNSFTVPLFDEYLKRVMPEGV